MQNYHDDLDGILVLLEKTNGNTTAHPNGAGRSFYKDGAIYPAGQFPKGLLTIISGDSIPPEENWTTGAD